LILKGKTCLITGATSGIGKQTAISLAKLGATIAFTAIDEAEGKSTRKEIIDLSGSQEVEFLICDLASFDSIKNCCSAFLKKYDALHILINNAAVLEMKRLLSKDGIEKTLAVNYLAPFLMTKLLIGALKESAPSRIINLTSGSHKVAKIDFNNIEMNHNYSGIKAYAQSKLAMILFTHKMAKKLSGTDVVINCVHPGRVRTNLIHQLNPLFKFIVELFMVNSLKGAETTVYVASSDNVAAVSGKYFYNKRVKKSSSHSYDVNIANKLWEVSEVYTDISVIN